MDDHRTLGDDVRHLIAEFDLPIPPSTNHIWRGVGRRIHKSKKYQAWLTESDAAILVQECKIHQARRPVKVLILITPGKGWRSNRDLDNCAKPILDYLVARGWLEDDSCQFVREVTVRLNDSAASMAYVTVSRIQ